MGQQACQRAAQCFHDHDPTRAVGAKLDEGWDGRITCYELAHAICVTQRPRELAEGETPYDPFIHEEHSFIDIHHRRPDGAVFADEGSSFMTRGHGRAAASLPSPAPLLVPPEFQTLKYNWRMERGPSVAGEEEALQHVLQPFAKAMVRGVAISLCLLENEYSAAPPNGEVDAVARLDADLTVLHLTKQGVERSMPLRGISTVAPCSWQAYPDSDRVILLVMKGGRHAACKLAGVTECDYFGCCMRLLVKAERHARSRRGKKQAPGSGDVDTGETLDTIREWEGLGPGDGSGPRGDRSERHPPVPPLGGKLSGVPSTP